MGMYYVYMDETGNQRVYGKNGNSRYFLIVFLITKNSDISEQILKKTFKWMVKKGIKHKGGVFHASNELRESRIKILEFSKGKDFSIATYYIDKTDMEGLSRNPHLLYNSMVVKLFKRCLKGNVFLKGDSIKFIAARKETNKFLNKQFVDQIKYELDSLLNIEVNLMYPVQNKGLQHVDSMALALLHKYEFNDKELYNIIEKNIIIEEPLPKKSY